MYSKKDAAILTEQFWLALGTYMKPILSAEGEKINWVNYKTGVKGIRFIMKAATSAATVEIKLSYAEIPLEDPFEKFLHLKTAFTNIVKEDWNWLSQTVSSNYKNIGEISTTVRNVNILNKNDWPQLISFFKSNMVLLDKFWSENKFVFEF